MYNLWVQYRCVTKTCNTDVLSVSCESACLLSTIPGNWLKSAEENSKMLYFKHNTYYSHTHTHVHVSQYRRLYPLTIPGCWISSMITISSSGGTASRSGAVMDTSSACSSSSGRSPCVQSRSRTCRYAPHQY